jgi:hypothetical protein
MKKRASESKTGFITTQIQSNTTKTIDKKKEFQTKQSTIEIIRIL